MGVAAVADVDVLKRNVFAQRTRGRTAATRWTKKLFQDRNSRVRRRRRHRHRRLPFCNGDFDLYFALASPPVRFRILFMLISSALSLPARGVQAYANLIKSLVRSALYTPRRGSCP